MKKLFISAALISIVGVLIIIYNSTIFEKPIQADRLFSLKVLETPVPRTYIKESAPDKWGRSPFIPLLKNEQITAKRKTQKKYLGKPYETLSLNGTFIRGKTRIAVINNRPLKIGDTINGHTVTIIKKNFVKFDDGTIIKVPGT